MGMKFTEDQQRVIDLRNCNILVSAAAGSGKTAVLVERIVELVSGSGCDSARAVDIDRLLIVTFTNAAAAQMRERITKALSDRVEAEPDNEHIKKQLMLIHNAKIMTIHSFCLYLIKNHFNDIGLDPDFRTADEGEIRLLKQEVLSELLEEQFALGRQEFTDCVEYFAYDGREKWLEELIERLYTFSGSYPFPEKWLRQHRMDYHVETFEELVKTEWFAGMMQEISALLQECKEQEKAALKVCEEPDGPYFYAVALEQDQELLAGLEQELASVVQTASEPEQSVASAEMDSSVAKDAFEALAARVQGISYARMAPKKDDSVSAEKRELVKAMRERVKSLLGTLSEKYFVSGPKQWLAECRQAVLRRQAEVPSLSVGALQHLLSQRCVLRGEDDLLGAGSVFHRQLHQQLHIFLTGQLRQLLPGLSEGIVNELLLAGEELLPAGAVGAALGSPLVLLGITGGLFLIRLAQLPGLVLVLLRDLLCLAASCRRQGFYLPLCIRLDALGDPFQSLHGLLRFTECW